MNVIELQIALPINKYKKWCVKYGQERVDTAISIEAQLHIDNLSTYRIKRALPEAEGEK